MLQFHLPFPVFSVSFPLFWVCRWREFSREEFLRLSVSARRLVYHLPPCVLQTPNNINTGSTCWKRIACIDSTTTSRMSWPRNESYLCPKYTLVSVSNARNTRSGALGAWSLSHCLTLGSMTQRTSQNHCHQLIQEENESWTADQNTKAF